MRLQMHEQRTLCLLLVFGLVHVVLSMNNPVNLNLAPLSSSLLWCTMYSEGDAPFGSQPASISLDLKVTNGKPENQFGYVIVYNTLYADHIGYRTAADAEASLCCTEDAVAKGVCTLSERNKPVIVPASDVFLFDQSQLSKVQTTAVSKTGVYVVRFVNCATVDSVSLVGSVVWKNPYGYLPGEVLMKFVMAGVYSLCYLTLTSIFAFLCYKYRAILMYLQYCILIVLSYAIVEHAAWFFYRLRNNSVGNYSFPALAFVVLLGNLNRVIMRLLVLLISMGFGVVKWTVLETPRKKMKVLFLSFLFLFFSFLNDMGQEYTALAKKDFFSSQSSLVVIIPAAITETIFYYWIIFSLIRTIQQLTLRHQQMKLDLYKNFLLVLVIIGILEVIYILFRVIIQLTRTALTWQYSWLLEAQSEVLYFLVLGAIAFLWRPRNNNMRYGYAEFFHDEEGDADETAGKEITDLKVKVQPGKKKHELTTLEKEILKIEIPAEDDSPGLDAEVELKKMD